jgi:hypothetical protein
MLLGLLGCAAGLAPRARADLPPTREPFLTDAWLDGLEDAFLKPRQTADDRPARVLFLGNSITLNHDVPARVAAWATRAGARIDVAMAAASGARLRETAQIARLRRLLRGGTWEILVLQDYTTMPFHAGERAASARTMAQLADLAQPEQVVLYPPWPRAPRHRFYSRAPAFLDLIPRGPAEFAEATMDFYGEVAQANGFAVAPVPEVWMQAVADQRPVYDQDNYHASAEGASLAARVIWQQLERGLAELA